MPLTYKDSGVDADAGDDLVDRIAPIAARTRTPFVLGGVGGFASLVRVPPDVEDPVLVAGTDGVGTKLKVAFATGIHDTVGIDLVAMCVNDVITTGARPLFFLDYFATGRLDPGVAEAVVRGVAEGCRIAGCALVGGETAELPGMYAPGEYDLAGFAVGVVGRRDILDGGGAAAGDLLVALPSSGLHSNGYSLARRAVEAMGLGPADELPGAGTTVARALLEPTRIYAGAVRALLEGHGGAVRALAHVTGGGLPGNLPRVLPDGLGARVRIGTWTRPPVFDAIARGGPIEEDEMRRTFNLGLGFVAVVAPSAAGGAIDRLRAAGEAPWIAGEVVETPPGTPFERRVEMVA